MVTKHSSAVPATTKSCMNYEFSGYLEIGLIIFLDGWREPEELMVILTCLTATHPVKSWWAEIILVTLLFIKVLKASRGPLTLSLFFWSVNLGPFLLLFSVDFSAHQQLYLYRCVWSTD